MAKGMLTLILLAAVVMPTSAQSTSPLQGVWRVVEMTVTDSPGGGHGPIFPIDGRPNGKPHPALPNAIDEMVRWLNQYLKGAI